MNNNKDEGILYICGTPIGNLKDITFRVLEVLKKVKLIAAEDTRHTKKLLNFYKIDTPLTSYFEYNKFKKAPYLIERLKEGEEIALVSDAGMPGISDPGYILINLALENNIKIIPIPGVSALITALTVSGLPTERFVFEGFITRKSKKRREYLKKIENEEKTYAVLVEERELFVAGKDDYFKQAIAVLVSSFKAEPIPELRREAEMTYGYEDDNKTIKIYLSREDVANRSNMTTSNAIRTLSTFAQEGVIAIDGRKIRILDLPKLERISELG